MANENICKEISNENLCLAIKEILNDCVNAGEETEVCTAKSQMIGKIAQTVSEIFNNNVENIYSNAKAANEIAQLADNSDCMQRYASIEETEQLCDVLSQNIQQCAEKLSDSFYDWCKTTGDLIADYSVSLYNGVKSNIVSLFEQSLSQNMNTASNNQDEHDSMMKFALIIFGISTALAAATVLYKTRNCCKNQPDKPKSRELVDCKSLHETQIQTTQTVNAQSKKIVRQK